ncbi:hypothetical protein M3Y99_01114500 [Aphelenchoides fujianensis]|nr:hypothetical protein M3Y99_01114500 [Aphelenchoides fujianensis]
MSTEAWTGVAGSMLLAASAAAFPFVCGRRGRGFSVQPRHLDRPAEPPSLDTSEEGRPKTPFVAGGTTPPSRSRSLRTGRSERSAAPASSDSDRRPLASPRASPLAPEWTAKSPDERKPAGKTPQPAVRPPIARRDRLPRPQIPGSAISMLAVLKRQLPIAAYEPLGILQAACEELRFAARLLDRLPASSTGCPPTRRSACAAWRPSCSAATRRSWAASGSPSTRCSARPSTSSRTTAGGTTRSRRAERAVHPLIRSLQVGHHPAVSACHAEGAGWTWWQTLEGTTAPAFDGSVSATPLHPVRLRLANGEEYSWNKVTTIIQNARAEAEKRVVRNEGEMVIRSSTGVECRLQFAVESNAVEGRVRGRGGERTVRLLGQIVASGEQVALFEAPPPHEHAAAHYGFNRFTMALNELHADERPLLPPTDSRFRPDQRLLENGEPERAEEAKKRLEKEQRGRSALAHRPLWFERERDAFTGRSLWLSNGRYWPAKEARFEDPHSRRMVALFSTDNSQ